MPQKGDFLMLQLHSLVYLGGLVYFMSVNPVLKIQSVFASAITKLTLCVSELLYASTNQLAGIFFPK